MKTLSWILRLIVAGILLQTLYFKFTGHPESVYIFETVGMEPWGRWLSGIVELIASILILLPRSVIYGAILSLGVMGGAIFMHLTKLGIEVQNDEGTLFVLALVTFISSALVLLIFRRDIPFFGK